jgi:Zn-dependent protease/CBS domain-containing protein
MASDEGAPLAGTLHLGRVGGIPVRAHWSALGLLALVTLLLAADELPSLHPGAPKAVYWGVAAATSIVFFLGVCAHEFAHAVVARRCGLQVKQMTLWLLGGLTELEGEPPTARADALTAIAGPLLTILLAVGSGLLAAALGPHSVLGAACTWLTVMNALIAVFNLMPAAPLDGGRLLRAAVWHFTGDRRRAADTAASAGRLFGMTLIALGVLQTLAGSLGGVWLAVVGWFLVGSARGERDAGLPDRLPGRQAVELMAPTPLTCPGWWTVETVTRRFGPELARQPALPLVDLDGQLVGLVTLPELTRVRPAARSTLRVDRLPRRAPRTVPAEAPPSEVVSALRSAPVVVVVDGENRPLGVIDATILDRVARLAGLPQ